MVQIQLSRGISVAIVGSILLTEPAIAQVQPDGSLGNQSSVVNRNGGDRTLIQGGAMRGKNLFHSFSEFNVNRGEQVYFTQPLAIENIISRVTGKNASTIDGTLGVLGSANLFLINPNGIVFGRNARLDIQGSFLATTASQLRFEDGSQFSASDPETNPLLTISTPLGLDQWLPKSGTIRNQGNLSPGKDLTLSSQNLNLEGQLIAGGNINLLASEGLKIQDNPQTAFTVAAQGNLLLQGNQLLAINALSHPQSGVYSGKNLVLRSDNPVVGDAHFSAGGSFAVERLDGHLGDLRSWLDPVFEVAGDFSLESFTGASLQILAGGNVSIPGTVTINAPGEAFNDSTVVLTDGTTLNLNGTTERTLDIRAGTLGFFSTPAPGNPTGSNITIGSIVNETGSVFLTNQFQPNPTLTGDITVNSINTANGATSGLDPSLDGGSVFIDSRGKITISSIIADGRVNSLEPFDASSKGGNISLIAQGPIIQPFQTGDTPTTTNRSSIRSYGQVSGNISLTSQTEILQEGAEFGIDPLLLSEIHGISQSGQGGNINLVAPHITLNGSVITEVRDTANTSPINIQATDTLRADQSTVASLTYGIGDAGNLTIGAEKIAINYTFLGSISFAEGRAGDIAITTNTLTATQQGQIVTSTYALGDAGNITVKAADSIFLEGSSVDVPGVQSFYASAIFSTSNPESTGDSGLVRIDTGSLSLKEGALIFASSLGQGKAGQIDIQASRGISVDGAVFADFDGQLDFFQDVNPSGIVSQSLTDASGGGTINIVTPILQVTNGGTINTSTSGRANAGSINITATQFTSLDGFTAFEGFSGVRRSSIGVITDSDATGNAGTVNMTTPNLNVTNGARITAQTLGDGAGGRLNLQVGNGITLQGKDSGIFSNGTARGDGGQIVINAPNITIANGANIGVDSTGSGKGGELSLQSNSLIMENQGQITAETAGNTGGNITLKVSDIIVLRYNSTISSNAGKADGAGDGGNISIKTTFLVAEPLENSDITANAFAGKGGSIDITAQGVFGLRVLSRSQLESLLGTNDPQLLDPAFLPTSDITAISQLNPNLNGQVILRSPDADANLTTVTLPSEIVDSTQLIARGCSADGVRAKVQGSLIITGRGGLPTNPTGLISGETLLLTWDESFSPAGDRTTVPRADLTPVLVEVQTLVKRPDGRVILAANPEGNQGQVFWNPSFSCQDLP